MRSPIRKNRLDFITIQETKLEMVDDRMCRSLWGNNEYGRCFVSSVGRSGGIFSLWESSLGRYIFTLTGFGFAGVCLE